MIFAGVLASKLFVGRTFLSAELVRVALALLNFIDPADNPAMEKKEAWVGYVNPTHPLGLPRRGLSSRKYYY